MLIEKPKIRNIVKAACKEISDNGVDPTVEDILWLAHLAEKYVNPVGGRSEVQERPVQCGRALLYPLTVSADIWLRDCAESWWPRDKHPLMATYCELYAFANGRNPKAFRQGREPARLTVLAWCAYNLPCSYSQIEASLNELAGNIELVDIDNGEIVEQRDIGFHWGDEIALLSAVYRKSPSFFLRCSVSHCMDLLRYSAMAIGKPEMMNRYDKDKDDAFGKFRLAISDIISRGTNG